MARIEQGLSQIYDQHVGTTLRHPCGYLVPNPFVATHMIRNRARLFPHVGAELYQQSKYHLDSSEASYRMLIIMPRIVR